MKIKLEITASTELLEAIKMIFGGNTQQALSKPKEIESTAPAAQKKRSASADKTTVKEEPTSNSEASSEEVKDESLEIEKISLETVRATVQTKAQSGKRDQVKNLLTKFGVARVTDLPSEKYSEFHKEVEAL